MPSWFIFVSLTYRAMGEHSNQYSGSTSSQSYIYLSDQVHDSKDITDSYIWFTGKTRKYLRVMSLQLKKEKGCREADLTCKQALSTITSQQNLHPQAEANDQRRYLHKAQAVNSNNPNYINCTAVLTQSMLLSLTIPLSNTPHWSHTVVLIRLATPEMTSYWTGQHR